MKYLVLLVILGAVMLGYLTMFLISTAPHDPKDWHLDPLTVATCETPNCYRVAPEGSTEERIDAVAPVYDERAIVLAQAFDEFALAQRATTRIAGLPPELMMTYVQRSERMKFPDYLTIKFIELEGDRSTVAIYSRARYGHGDMGVNAARVMDWLNALAPFEVSDETPTPATDTAN